MRDDGVDAAPDTADAAMADTTTEHSEGVGPCFSSGDPVTYQTGPGSFPAGGAAKMASLNCATLKAEKAEIG